MPVERERFASPHPTGGRKRVKESFAAETDANRIVQKYLRGAPIVVNHRTGMYGDFSGIGDYHEVCNRKIEADNQFMQLPARVRALCRNDVGVFLEACSTKEGLEALRAAGMPGVLEPKITSVIEDPVEPGEDGQSAT